MTDFIWFLIFCFFVFYAPFKWWQSREQERNLQTHYEKQNRNLQWDNDAQRDATQALGQKIQLLQKQLNIAKDSTAYYSTLYYNSDEKLQSISDYIYGNDLEYTPLGEHILRLIEEEEEVMPE